jgi:hypothetical protein
LTVEALGGESQLCECVQRAPLLVWGEVGEKGGQLTAAQQVDLLDRVAPRVRRDDRDDAPVIFCTAALNETVLDHPVDDAGHIGQRHLERFGETAHGRRTIAQQHEENVKLRRGNRAQAALLGDSSTLSGNQGL